MFSRKKTTMSLYLTHGAAFVMKGVAHKQPQKEPHLIATCSYKNNKKTYKIENIKQLSEQISETSGARKSKLIKLTSEYREPLSQAKFDYFVYEIKKYFKANHVNLYADGNLFHPSCGFISAELSILVETTKPQTLILFSDTPECLDDARNYLNRRPTNNNHQLPHYRLNATATTRQNLAAAIRQEKNFPTMIPIKNGCLNFFSRHTPKLLLPPKVYARDDTQSITAEFTSARIQQPF